MKITIVSGDALHQQPCGYEYQQNEEKRPMALDVLIQAKASAMPELAFRYGCRNELCGVCTIEVNGNPRLACRCRVDEGDVLSPLSTLPQIRDLIVTRSQVNRQLQNTIPPTPAVSQRSPSPEEISLNRCIECYGCLSDCPMYERNNISKNNFSQKSEPENKQTVEELKYGNPYTLLKIRQATLAEQYSDKNKNQLVENTIELGLDSYLDCDGCKCQVGISLTSEVIGPLLALAAAKNSRF